MTRRLCCNIERRWTANLDKRSVELGCEAITSRPEAAFRVHRLAASFASSSLNGSDIAKLLPPRFLREADSANYDAFTHQRNDVSFDTDNGKPLPLTEQLSMYDIRSCTFDDDGHYTIEWGDGKISRYAEQWVEDTVARWKGKEDETTPRVLWSNLTEAKVRKDPSLSLGFSVILEKTGMDNALKALYQYGFVLVTETPIDDGGAGIAALASAVSGGSAKQGASNSLLASYRSGGKDIILPHGTDGPLRTLYGTLWSTTSSGQADGASVADSAYGKGGLPLHTDMTYHQEPPGLQIFTMVQPALQGGESVFADGFAAANYLRFHHPDAFVVLNSIVRTYRCIDNVTGWNLEGKGPVISTTNIGALIAIRHNDLDRLPDLPPCGSTVEESKAFYEKLSNAHEKWNEVLSRDEFRLVMNMRPGDTAIVANQVSGASHKKELGKETHVLYSIPIIF